MTVLSRKEVHVIKKKGTRVIQESWEGNWKRLQVGTNSSDQSTSVFFLCSIKFSTVACVAYSQPEEVGPD